MGKALVIKGADFSQVKVETIDIDGKVFLTPKNYLATTAGYYSSGTKKWTSSDNTISAFWPIKAGQFLVIEPGEKETGMFFYLSDSSKPAVNTMALDFAEGGEHDKSLQIIKCVQDCFVCCIVKDGATVYDTFPTVYLTEDAEDVMSGLQIEKENSIMHTYLYLNSAEGAWRGTDSTASLTKFYPVIKGEKIVVKANDNRSTTIGFVSGTTRYKFNNTNGDLSDNSNAAAILNNNLVAIDGTNYGIIVAAGETSPEITIPQNGYLSIFAEDSGNDKFPASVEITV